MLTNVYVLLTVVFLTTAQNAGYTYAAPRNNNLEIDNTGYPGQATNDVGSSNDVNTVDEINNVGIDEYNFQYTLSDGTLREEEGKFVDGVWTVTGTSIWYDENHQYVYKLDFIADDQGFRKLPGFSGGNDTTSGGQGYSGGISQNTGFALVGIGK